MPSRALERFQPLAESLRDIHTLVTGPGVWCAFDSNGCSHAIRAFGGFDEHHPWPLSAGGPTTQKKLVLCPNHHRRQHAAFRYFVECDEDGHEPDYWGVLIHMQVVERRAAQTSFSDWVSAGRPDINGWSCLAASAA